MNKRQIEAMKECAEMVEMNRDKDCLGCPCNVCVAQFEINKEQTKQEISSLEIEVNVLKERIEELEEIEYKYNSLCD